MSYHFRDVIFSKPIISIFHDPFQSNLFRLFLSAVPICSVPFHLSSPRSSVVPAEAFPTLAREVNKSIPVAMYESFNMYAQQHVIANDADYHLYTAPKKAAAKTA